MKRLILETGIGTDLYGEDATKAAIRGVNDAIRHSSLPLYAELGVDHKLMKVEVTVGVPDPTLVDCDRVAEELPRGRARVRAVAGGQRIASPDGTSSSIVATVAVEAWLDTDAIGWTVTRSETSVSAHHLRS